MGFELREDMVSSVCMSACAMHGDERGLFYEYFVIRNGGYCGCGFGEYGKYGLVADSLCSVVCLGDLESTKCGGLEAYSAYEIEYYAPMMLEKSEGVLHSVNENVTVKEASDEKARDVLEEYEYYYSMYSSKGISGSDNTLTLPLQRGFTVDPMATYKIWYGPNLRRRDVEENAGESCVSLTVDIHEHPVSWLEAEREETIDDGASESFDYNQLFL